MIAFTLPWPDSRLNPNRSKGAHWAATSKARKDARLEAYVLARQASPVAPQFSGAVALSLTFIQPDRRARDRDNLLAAMKPSLDGVADALGINDAQFEPITLSREYGGKPGIVRITIGSKA